MSTQFYIWWLSFQHLKNYLSVTKVADVILKGSWVSCQGGLWLTFRNLGLPILAIRQGSQHWNCTSNAGVLNTCFPSGSLKSQFCVRQWALSFSWAFLMDISQLWLQYIPGRLTYVCVTPTRDTAEELAPCFWSPWPHVSFLFFVCSLACHCDKL